MILNCDIGERGTCHPVDLALMDYIQMANIACGGHAGDAGSAAFFMNLARGKGVAVAAHLSYPDRAGFGRCSMSISPAGLFAALDSQLELIPGTKTVKFHGALYNDAVVDENLAGLLARWAKKQGIDRVVTMPDSALAGACGKEKITVIREAFVERRYTCDLPAGPLRLVDRSREWASIADCDEAIEQALKIVRESRVDVYPDGRARALRACERTLVVDTVCIHSDSPLSLDLARRLVTALSRKGMA